MSVDPNQAKSIFLEAVELYSPDQWSDYLDKACGDDADLRQRVETLLSAHQHADELTSEGAAAFQAFLPKLVSQDSERPGAQIGPYRLIEQLGYGGMGVVYLAEQEQPVQRQVALKIIRPGLDNQRVIERFEGERQALAIMDHPNIAKVYDAGTTESGRPYFVMEVVQGQSITNYCDQHHLSLRQRLELFIPVCQAVQHAHQKGIIHRDIKPSNILVAEYEEQRVPKVIDFGVAKAVEHRLTQKQLSTEYGQIVGTLEYMSPEQARLDPNDVDTRSDIYALGAVLYELLSGSTPFDRQHLYSGAFDHALHIIESEDPVKPSMRLSSSDSLPSVAAVRHIEPQRLTSTIRGELDWIVMKALEKDRTRRYDSATGLAQDIQNYLENRPVLAGPPSAGYRFRKFARRNKAVIATVTAVALALIVGTGVATWQAVRAHNHATRADKQAERATAQALRAERGEQLAAEEAERATAEAATAEAVLQFLNNDLLARSSPLVEPDRDIKLRTLLDRTSNKVSDRFQEQPLAAAKIHLTLARAYRGLGESDKAVAHGENALNALNAIRGREHRDTILAIDCLANAYAYADRSDEALPLFEESLSLRLSELGANYPDTFTSMQNLAGGLQAAGRSDEAISLMKKTLKWRRKTLEPGHQDTLATLQNLGWLYAENGRWAEAVPLLEESLELARRILGPEHPNTSLIANNLARAYRGNDRLDDAQKLHESALMSLRQTTGPKHPRTLTVLIDLAKTHLAAGRLDAALPVLEEGVQLSKQIRGTSHASTIGIMNDLAHVYQVLRRKDAAIQLYEEALEANRAVRGPSHPATLSLMGNLGNTYRIFGQVDKGLKMIEEVLAIRKQVSGTDSPATLTVMDNLAQAYFDAGRHEESILLFSEALERKTKLLGAGHSVTLTTMNNLAYVHLNSNRVDEALRLSERSLALYSGESLGEAHPKTLSSMTSLAGIYWMAGRRDEAMELYEKALQLQTEHLGTTHPDTLKTLNNLTVAYTQSGATAKAMEIGKRTLELMRQAYAPDHPRRLKSMKNLAVAYQAASRHSEALTLYEKRLSVSRDRHGPTHVETVLSLGDLAKACLVADQIEKAVPLFEQFVAAQRVSAGPDDPHLAVILAVVAVDLLEHGECAASETYLRECLSIREQIMPDDWLLFNTKSMLGEALACQANELLATDTDAAEKKFAQAESLLLSGYEGMKQREATIPAGGNERLPQAARRLVDLYTAWGKTEEAASWRDLIDEKNNSTPPSNASGKTADDQDKPAPAPD